MCIIEQVEKLIEDMKQLNSNLIDTDEENIDLEQLKKLKVKCNGFMIKLNSQIKRIEGYESEDR